MSTQDGQVWRVGQLAAETGLTVRALHHYDQLGLVRPSRRTPSGYRLYAARDVERLYQVTPATPRRSRAQHGGPSPALLDFIKAANAGRQ